MTIGELRTHLQRLGEAPLHIMLPTGEFVPSHFHVTEVGRVQKDFIDCGGTVRSSVTCLLQLWVADDVEHRLHAGKLASILTMAQKLLGSEEWPVELEYEGEAVSQYPLADVEMTPAGGLLTLARKHTDCLAKDRCGVPANAGAAAGAGCTPGAGCC
jgi:hypothetical protein